MMNDDRKNTAKLALLVLEQVHYRWCSVVKILLRYDSGGAFICSTTRYKPKKRKKKKIK